MVQKNRRHFSQTLTRGGVCVPRLCCRREAGEDDAAGFANTTGWRPKGCQTIGTQCKADDLVDAPEAVQVAGNAFARAAHSEAVAWPEKEVEQVESRHHEPVCRGYCVELGSRMVTIERHEPGLQVGNGRR